jgi:hypothetical protein
MSDDSTKPTRGTAETPMDEGSLERVSGGFNPQPEPPGTYQPSTGSELEQKVRTRLGSFGSIGS